MLRRGAVARAPASCRPTRPRARARSRSRCNPVLLLSSAAPRGRARRACRALSEPTQPPELVQSRAAQVRPPHPLAPARATARAGVAVAHPCVLHLARDSSPPRRATPVRSRWTPAAWREGRSPVPPHRPNHDRPVAASDSEREVRDIRGIADRRRSLSPHHEPAIIVNSAALNWAAPFSLSEITRSFPTTTTRVPSANAVRNSGSRSMRSK